MKIIKTIINTLLIFIPVTMLSLASMDGYSSLGIAWVIAIALLIKGIMNIFEKKNKSLFIFSIILVLVLLFFQAQEILRDLSSG